MNKETIMKFLRRFKIWGLLSELFDRGYIYRLADVPRQSRQSELMNELLSYHREPQVHGLSGTDYILPGDNWQRGAVSHTITRDPRTPNYGLMDCANNGSEGAGLLISDDVPRLEMDTGSNVGSALTYSDPVIYERAMEYQYPEAVQSGGAQTSPPPAVPEGRSLTSEEINQIYNREITRDRGAIDRGAIRSVPPLRTSAEHSARLEPSGYVTISGKELDRLKVTRNGKFTNEGKVFNFKQ